MRSVHGFLPPSNEYFKGDTKNKENRRLFYSCKKCHQKIWAHVLNEHLRFCGKKKVESVPATNKIVETPSRQVPNRKVRLVNRTIRSNRYNKTKYK